MKYDLDIKKHQGIPADETQMDVRRRINQNRIITKNYFKNKAEEELAENNTKLFLNMHYI